MEPFEISNSDFTEWDSALLVQHYPIIELKKPERKDYSDKNNPFVQVDKYIERASDMVS
ncbi:MAG: hypothetical protein GY749_30390 [Desulfobacteraceae bacterium]|nr:hypothetical protein [Desulfobacteraceae bacterium]